MRQIPEDKGFKARHLVDTQYLSRVVFRLIDEHLEFAQSGDRKRRTQTVNGAITAEVRKRLGIEKIRENGDFHHAADAAVIACISPGMIQKITKYAQNRERFYKLGAGYVDGETGEILTRDEYDAKYSPHFPEPWLHFRKELEARLSDNPQEAISRLKLSSYEDIEEIKPAFVSRMPKHKATGKVHEDTIRRAKKEGPNEYLVSRTALTNLKLKKGKIVGPDPDKTEYDGTDDMLLYHALLKQLEAFDGDGTRAFAEPFHKPKADGTPGPLVKKVKVCQRSTIHVPVNGGIAENKRRIRVDVFRVEKDGYYFVPIYIADAVKTELPNKAVVAHKPYELWKPMREEDFLFSMYQGDLLYIRGHRKITLKIKDGGTGEEKISRSEGLFYYEGFDISNGSLEITTPDRSYCQSSLGGKTLDSLEKYQVDVLGEYTPVRLPEKRQKLR